MGCPLRSSLSRWCMFSTAWLDGAYDWLQMTSQVEYFRLYFSSAGGKLMSVVLTDLRCQRRIWLMEAKWENAFNLIKKEENLTWRMFRMWEPSLCWKASEWFPFRAAVCRVYLQRKHTIRAESTWARAAPLIYQGRLWWLLIEMPALKFCAQPHV